MVDCWVGNIMPPALTNVKTLHVRNSVFSYPSGTCAWEQELKLCYQLQVGMFWCSPFLTASVPFFLALERLCFEPSKPEHFL